MNWFWSRSIKKKLMLLFTLNTTLALALACIVFWIYLTFSYRETLVNEEATISQMLAESSAPALTFLDQKAATETLSGLRAEPRMEGACLYDKQGHVFATYFRDAKPGTCPPAIPKRSSHFNLRELIVSAPVALDHDFVGSLLLRVSLTEMYSQLIRFASVSYFVLLAASLFALLMSMRLQRLISAPIIHLTQVAGRVSLDGNYSIRAATKSDDETGVLIGQFNSMMEQVNQRDLKLQKAQDELEGRVEERTRELQKEIAEREVIQHDLLNAKLLAEESNRAKSTFMANMSHELRTPLNAILGYSEMLQEDAEAIGDKTAVEDLSRIQSAGRHLLVLINDVLDLSKVEAGRVELSLESIVVSHIVDDVVSTIEPLAKINQNTFVTNIEDPNAVVNVDAVKFRQCLLNLLSNAFKFTDHGKISLSVSQRIDGSGAWVCWEVSDTGIGIATQDKKKLFQAFSQVDSSATRRHDGTGLGLAISQKLTHLMGGWIDVDTELGKGSKFTIHLPAVGSFNFDDAWKHHDSTDDAVASSTLSASVVQLMTREASSSLA